MIPLGPRINLFGAPAFYKSITESTMEDLALLALENYPSGTLVMAGFQSAGKGQMGRKWEGESGLNLAFSFLLRERFALPPSLLWGLAVSQYLDTLGVNSQIKWPNDVLVKGEKISGILVHRRGDVTITGIGLNVKQREFPLDLRRPATSLWLQGITLEPLEILEGLLKEIQYVMNLSEPRRFVQDRLWCLGEPISLSVTEGVTVVGILKGLGDQGQALLETIDGPREVFSGETP